MFSESHLGQNSILSGNKRAFTDDLEPFIDTPDLSDLFSKAVENDFLCHRH
jgi:hypothetical protein